MLQYTCKNIFLTQPLVALGCSPHTIKLPTFLKTWNGEFEERLGWKWLSKVIVQRANLSEFYAQIFTFRKHHSIYGSQLKCTTMNYAENSFLSQNLIEKKDVVNTVHKIQLNAHSPLR